MESLVKAVSKLVKNIHLKCKSSCCECDSDCNKPELEEAIETIVEEAVEHISEKLKISLV